MKDDPSGIPRLFKIHYYVLEKDVGTQKKGLYLTEYPVEQSFLDSPPPGRRITDIFEDFHFEYGYWNPIESKIITKEKWTDSEKIPKIVILSGKSQKEKEFAKTIILPIGELMEFEEEEEEEDDDDDHDDSRYEAQAGSIRNSVNSQTSSYPKGTADRFSKGIGWGTGAPASGSRGTHGRQSVELQKEEEEETELPKMMPIDE
jgi:hypothetical protein